MKNYYIVSALDDLWERTTLKFKLNQKWIGFIRQGKQLKIGNRGEGKSPSATVLFLASVSSVSKYYSINWDR